MMANEKRLIDANALVKKFWQEECRTQTRRDFAAMVDYAPTVDAVEVVRCKNCRMYVENKKAPLPHSRRCLRNVYGIYARPDDFCSYGERKDDEKE